MAVTRGPKMPALREHFRKEMTAPQLKGLKAKATTKPRYGQMNKLEAKWAGVLDEMMATGGIVRWDFEPEKLRLADGAYYSPDFRVILNDLTIEFHECKGFMREAAHVRLKVAADQHPYAFKLIRWADKQWKVTDV